MRTTLQNTVKHNKTIQGQEKVHIILLGNQIY